MRVRYNCVRDVFERKLYLKIFLLLLWPKFNGLVLVAEVEFRLPLLVFNVFVQFFEIRSKS